MDKILFDYTKEAIRQITHHKQQTEYWSNILNKITDKTDDERNYLSSGNNLNDLKYLYFSDNDIAKDKIKRAGFWLRSTEAKKIIDTLKNDYGIEAIFPRESNRQEPLMFAGLYIHYAKWVGANDELTAKLQVFNALREHCIKLEFSNLRLGDISTILGVYQ